MSGERTVAVHLDGSGAAVRSDKVVIGAQMIAKRLGVCERTARRLIAAGKLHAWKLNGDTSPFRAWASDIDRLKDAC